MELEIGDIYSPLVEGVGEHFGSPRARIPLENVLYEVLETPYIRNLEILLAEGLNRPVTVFNKQMNKLFSWAFEMIFLPITLVSLL